MVVLEQYRTAAGSAMPIELLSGALVSSVLAMTGLAEKAGRRVVSHQSRGDWYHKQS